MVRYLSVQGVKSADILSPKSLLLSSTEQPARLFSSYEGVFRSFVRLLSHTCPYLSICLHVQPSAAQVAEYTNTILGTSHNIGT